MGDQNRCVAIEADRTAIGAADLLCRPHDDRAVHVALLDPTARDCLLDRDDDYVANRCGLAFGSSQHLDALCAACARVVGDVEIGLHLDHAASPPCSTGSTAGSTRASSSVGVAPP